ncbi:hypothetical protein L195_g023023 [Trifolium pratense]|uniref:Uncharacterized protein n=1 Tax=Trifolium pratense TaxID=57577 RepID=A0A2K3N9S0_TRIPR|nr:hypothetical protein L195_g023023 [Trifolium pratense]
MQQIVHPSSTHAQGKWMQKQTPSKLNPYQYPPMVGKGSRHQPGGSIRQPGMYGHMEQDETRQILNWGQTIGVNSY